MVLTKILVALDCSNISEQVVKALGKLNLSPKAQIIFCHVLPSPSGDSDLAVDQPHPVLENLRDKAEKQLRTYQAQFPSSEVEIVSGDVTEEIIRLANIHQVELILIGTRGLRGVDRILQNSVSSQLVADSPCSVFVVR